ncbi:MAG: hypothetical protein AB7Q00_14530 [Phycisphaerales bacterium]
MKTVDTSRKLYKIVKGTYSRRDGEPVQVKDPRTGEVIKDANGKALRKRAHVIYQAKSSTNPHARDEIYMTDVEAFRFGLHRLKQLVSSNVQTLDVENAASDEEDAQPEIIAALIEEGNVAAGPKAVKAWKEKVAKSKVLNKVPDRKGDILEALTALIAGDDGEGEPE